jgi:AP-3 complex subunit mu
MPNGILSQMPWRKADVKYTQNEIYFDVLEEVDCIIDSRGQMVSCEVAGRLDCNCRLSGVPDLTLSLANPSCVTDVSFHPCVRYSRYEREKLISFVPPDGNFRLMKYRVTKPGPKGMVDSPVYCRPTIAYDASGGSGRLSIMVKAKSSNSLRSTKRGKAPTMEDVAVVIAFSDAVQSIDVDTCSGGTCEFDEVTKVCRWKIGKIAANAPQPLLQGRLALAQGSTAAGETTNVRMEFKVPDCTVSGLRIDNLHLSNENYKPYKGVRAVTQAGRYQVRA